MKLIKLENKELSKAVADGDAYIQIGSRKFLLLEVEEVRQPEYYEVTDPEEEKQLQESMQGENPSYSTQEVLDRLAQSRNQ